MPKVELKQEVFSLNNPIAFIHTRKTGGSSIDFLMKAICVLDGYKYIDSGDTVELFIPRGGIAGITAIKENLELSDLRNKPETQFVRGHMPLPDTNYFKVDLDYISVVRNPLDRIFSLMNFLYQAKYAEIEDIKIGVLNQNDNIQTRFLAGEKYMGGECTEDTYNQAVKNIQEKFVMVAPNEEVDLFMAIIAKRYDKENFAYTRARITAAKVFRKEDDDDFFAEIIQKNQYDIRLHEFVKSNWNSWKNEYIESISDNKYPDQEYIVMTKQFYADQKTLFSSSLDQIHSYEANNEGLIGIA